MGHKAARAGLLIPVIVFKRSLDITNKAPVLPAEREISDFFSLKDSTAFHMLVFLLFFAPVNALSSSETISSVLIISQYLCIFFFLEISFSNKSFFPYKEKKFSWFVLKEISIPSIIFFGESIPPIASIAIFTLFNIIRYSFR